MKSVAGEYAELRARQRVAMAQQMALDDESLRKLDAAKAMEPVVSRRRWPRAAVVVDEAGGQ